MDENRTVTSINKYNLQKQNISKWKRTNYVYLLP